MEYSRQYPYPEYDLITAVADDLDDLSAIFGAIDKFAGVEIEGINAD